MFSIKIPSKNIYEVSNQKVIDNQIDRIEVAVTRPSIVNHYNEVVYTTDISTTNATTDDAATGKDHDGTANSSQYFYSVVYGFIKPYYRVVTVIIPKNEVNKQITKIIGGVNNNGEPNINYSTLCEVKTAPATANYKLDGYQVLNISYTYPSSGELKTVTLPKEEEIDDEYHVTSPNTTLHSYTKIVLDDKTSLKNVGTDTIPILELGDEKYYFTTKLLCGVEVVSLKGHGSGTSPAELKPISGQATLYQPNSVTITVYGNSITLDLKQDTLIIGNGNKSMSFTNSNELMQPTMKNIVSNATLSNMWQNVLDEWKNGKETATILKAGASNNNINHIGVNNPVSPYVLGANGKDKPMSIYKDGTPMVFNILSTKTIYDGALWQEIGIQEVKQTNSQ